ncbi:hypothetical protein [Streptomyces sp. NPDC049813]|uniref:hypothetical protein n=1 Tax=Streptomyces sp. NPDC049813 TaxID=3365597 RepID=UPI00378C40FD
MTGPHDREPHRAAPETPIYDALVRLWQAHGRAVPVPPRPARPARGWVRVDPAAGRKS